eukprot:TRINITY_DN661_c0_g1_i8.p2 TRINITY_DN661_c0_g1~~TRINITY_DN661_c0_g1_i8.p2  ORF type:complete len:211 (+),score=-13.69 TRINITY_DN661_c0_g1_i8:266-898(+)
MLITKQVFPIIKFSKKSQSEGNQGATGINPNTPYLPFHPQHLNQRYYTIQYQHDAINVVQTQIHPNLCNILQETHHNANFVVLQLLSIPILQYNIFVIPYYLLYYKTILYNTLQKSKQIFYLQNFENNPPAITNNMILQKTYKRYNIYSIYIIVLYVVHNTIVLLLLKLPSNVFDKNQGKNIQLNLFQPLKRKNKIPINNKMCYFALLQK